MDLTQLRYFRAIAGSGSMSAAARKLGVSQPTLSQATKQLEQELGATLLFRGRSGVSLTRTGQALLRGSGEIFSAVERTAAAIRGLEEDNAGRFIIGCHESLGAYFLPPFMRSFLEDAPQIEVVLWNGTSSAVQDAVITREIDFGLVVNPERADELVQVDLFPDQVEVVGVTGAPDATTDDIFARIRRGPLVHAGRLPQSQRLIDRLAARELLPERMLNCGDLELVKSLLLSGVGVGLLPRRVATYGHEGKLRPLHPDLPVYQDRIFLLYRSDMHRTRGALKLKNRARRPRPGARPNVGRDDEPRHPCLHTPRCVALRSAVPRRAPEASPWHSRARHGRARCPAPRAHRR